MSKKQVSITGIEYNNPKICIKGISTFACICPKCRKEYTDFLTNLLKEI